MPHARQLARSPPGPISITEFKGRARALLSPDHPLIYVLARTPDLLTPEEFAAKLDDWVALLDLEE